MYSLNEVGTLNDYKETTINQDISSKQEIISKPKTSNSHSLTIEQVQQLFKVV